jgi:hypothetical protein
VGTAAGSAWADTVTFRMNNIHWHNTTYIGNVSTPRPLDWYGSGSFTWTFTPGSFDSGHGTLVSIDIPPWGVGPGGWTPVTTIDTSGITTTIAQNVDNFSYDIALSFSPALTGPSQTVNISGGSYAFAPGYYQFVSGEYDGTITGGTVAVCPAINTQPAAKTVCPTGSAPFSVVASGSAPFTYQWQVQTSPGVWQTMGNDPGPLPCGGGASSYATPINSASVTIGLRPCPGNAGAAERFQIRCIVANACGTGVTSNEATYTICPADFDCNGTLAVSDIFSYLNAWFAGVPGAEFDGVSGLQIADIFAFLNAWFAGC